MRPMCGITGPHRANKIYLGAVYARLRRSPRRPHWEPVPDPRRIRSVCQIAELAWAPTNRTGAHEAMKLVHGALSAQIGSGYCDDKLYVDKFVTVKTSAAPSSRIPRGALANDKFYNDKCGFKFTDTTRGARGRALAKSGTPYVSSAFGALGACPQRLQVRWDCSGCPRDRVAESPLATAPGSMRLLGLPA